MKTKLLIVAILAALSVFTSNVYAKEWRVEMLNYDGEEGMLFKPAFIHAAVGDSVTFVPSHSGHYAQSYQTPPDVKGWKSPLDKEFTLKLTEQGLHVYYCPPHLMMGMVGVIQVGEAVNLAEVNNKAERLKSKMHLKPKRLEALLNQVEAVD